MSLLRDILRWASTAIAATAATSLNRYIILNRRM